MFRNMPEHCHGHRSVGVGMPPRRRTRGGPKRRNTVTADGGQSRQSRPVVGNCFWVSQNFEIYRSTVTVHVGSGSAETPRPAKKHLNMPEHCHGPRWVGIGGAAPPTEKHLNMPEHCHGPGRVGVGKPPRPPTKTVVSKTSEHCHGTRSGGSASRPPAVYTIRGFAQKRPLNKHYLFRHF